jgi:gamma-glutamyltranspeptidase / glutathione hydrolase
MNPMPAFAAALLAALGLTAQAPLNVMGRGAQGANGVVASAKPEATQTGLDILRQGGNAVDAAIATAFAIGVLEPDTNGLGGGGFMIVKLAAMKEAVVIDFREVAPAAARPDLFRLNEKGQVIARAHLEGGLAIGVPGDVAGLLHALDHYGSRKLSRTQILKSAITWATEGVPVTANLDANIKDTYEKIRAFPATAALFLQDGLPYDVGDRIRNPDLAASLKLIADQGADAYYRGELARKIVDEVRRQKGILSLEDLATYQVKVLRPVQGTYRGYTVISTPPASSGGTHLVQLLNILENFDLRASGPGTTATAHTWSEALKLVFADRAKFMGDPAFVQVPVQGLLSKDYAKELAARITGTSAKGPVEAGDPWKYESGSTTHISVMDKEGNMVAITKSIGTLFGSGVMVPGTGILLNSHMGDFSAKPGSANSVAAGKRPLSSMSPTLVLDPKGRPFMTLGSPGATRIFPTVAQVISNVIDFGMPLQDAINAPRWFQIQTGPLTLEGRIPVSTFKGLGPLGHDLQVNRDWDPYFGGVQGVLFDHERRVLLGGADPRRDGQAMAF